MHPASVKKHAGHQGKERWNRNGFLRKRSLAENNGRDGTILKCEPLGCLPRKIHLVEKRSDTEADEDHRDDGSLLSGIIVVERNHGSPTLWSSAAIADRTRQSGIGWQCPVDLEWSGQSSSMSMACASEGGGDFPDIRPVRSGAHAEIATAITVMPDQAKWMM